MNTTMTTTIETITPEVAKSYLQCNIGRNRRVHPKVISKYARDMKNGCFKMTHQGIAFDVNGNLIDCQRRLLGVLMSGQPITTLVSRNVPEESMQFIDRATSRTVHDSLTISNPGNDEVSKVIKNASVPATLRQLVVCSLKNMSLSVSEINKLFAAFQTEMVSLYRLNDAKHNGANRCQLLSAAIAAMHCGVSADVIDKFFQVFRKADITECAGYNVNAAMDWRRQIDEAKYRGNRMSGDRVFLGTQNAIYNFAMNTDVHRIVIPKIMKYDVSAELKEILSL